MDLVRKIIESTYCDTCTVTEWQKEKIKGVVSSKEVIVFKEQPCKLSFGSLNAADGTESVTETKQCIKLFLAPELEIKAGSKINVEHCGNTYEYMRSGIPAVYDTHQEIVLDTFKERA